MIPEIQHAALFDAVRRGARPDVRVHKGPGNVCFREGKITDVFFKGKYIEHVIVKLYRIGYDPYDTYKFPIQQVSLIYPIHHEKRYKRSYEQSYEQPHDDGIVNAFVEENEHEVNSDAEHDDYPDEVEYLDENEMDENEMDYY